MPKDNLKAFMAFLQYLYTDGCPIAEEEVTNILVLADKYFVNRLKALCEHFISEIIKKASKTSIADSKLGVISKYNNTYLILTVYVVICCT